jgi:hypothetical protein
MPFGSKPTNSFSQSITWCSIVVADGAERQDVTFWLSADARKSATTPGKLPADWTYPNMRGCPLWRLPATTCAKSAITAAASCGSLGSDA